MAKKVYNMSNDERKLYNELKKEVTKANSRIRNLLKLGIEEPFAVKQLHSYLGAKTIEAITKSGYISLKRDHNLQQLLGIKRATTNFLNDVSTIKEINKLKQRYETAVGKELDLRQVDTLYQLENNYEWIYEYIPKSEFWQSYAPLVYTHDLESWIEQLYYRNQNLADEDLRNDLEALYIYCKKE